MRQFSLMLRASGAAVLALTTAIALAAVTAEQKKELKDIGSDITKISTLTKGKKYDEAEKALKEAEQRLDKVVKEASLTDADPSVKPIRIQLDKARTQFTKASGRGTVSFVKDVAPILASKCVGCHAEGDAKGGLRLDTYAAMEKGGRNGPLCQPGNAEASALVMKLVTPNAQARMPKGDEPLKDKEIQLIATWVNEGAKFDGADKNTELTALDKRPANNPAAAAKVEIARATGKETVSFMKDLMPELVDTCGRCHNDQAKRGGLSVMSFEKLMQGGASGRVVVAGSLTGSRMMELIEEGKMPMGNQTGITRKWYNNLKKWIEEGAKFDGDDAKKTFPTLDQREAAALAQLTPEQWIERRKKDSLEKWKKTFPTAEPKIQDSNEFLILGDVAPERLEQVEKWAQDQSASLKSAFGVKETMLWKGKLAIFVFKERFGYEEFNQSVNRREVDRDMFGHSEVNATMEDALVALQDVGDAATETSPGMQVNVIENVTGAFLKRGGGNTPEWVVRGTGLALANQHSKGNPFLMKMPGMAGEILRTARMDKPEDIFGNGTFSPSEVAPIGFTLVDFMLKRGGPANFGQFVRRVQGGERSDAAIKAVYNTDGKSLAIAYANSLPQGSKKPKK